MDRLTALHIYSNLMEGCFKAFAQAEIDLYRPVFCVHNNEDTATFGGNDVVAAAMLQLVQIIKNRNLLSFVHIVASAPGPTNQVRIYDIMRGLSESAKQYSTTDLISSADDYSSFDIWTMTRLENEWKKLFSQIEEAISG